MLEDGMLTIGANYWASHTATQMWRDWRPNIIERDFKILAEYKITLLRVFPIWNDFQPIYAIRRAMNESAVQETRMFDSEQHCPDTPAGFAGVDEKMMERFTDFCDLAEKYNIKLIVCLLTGHMTLRLFIPRALEMLDLYTDPVALKWEGRFIDYFVTRMKRHTAIWAWESGNETCCIGNIKNSAHAESWLRYIHSTIRLADPSRPLIGINGLNITEKESPWISSISARFSDYVTVHPYNMWSKAGIEEFNSIRNMLYCAAQSSALEQITDTPAFVEETGLWRPMAVSLEGLAKYQRGLLWNLWSANCRGMLWWCAFDQDIFDSAPYDWPWAGLEHGLLTSAHEPHPGAKTIKKFGEFLQTIDFGSLPKAKKDILILAANRDIVHSSYILSRQAGLIPEYQASDAPLRHADFYFIPVAKARAELTTRRWEDLLAEIRSGATLFLSWDDTYLTHLNDVCGIEVVSRHESSGTMEYSFENFSLHLPHPLSVIFRSIGAEILAHDADGNPCFFRNRYGKGIVYTLGFPLENLLYNTVGLYNSEAWKIYAQICPKKQLVSAISQFVSISEHYFDERKAAVMLVNNSMELFSERIEIADSWHVTKVYTDSPEDANFYDGVLSLTMNAGMILLCEKSKA